MVNEPTHDKTTRDSIASLLGAAERAGVGVTFTPENGSWDIGYLEGRHGGPLAQADSLLAASNAALDALRQAWPQDGQGEVPAFVVLLPDRAEAVLWHLESEEYLQCIARNVNGSRCRNGVFDDQPGLPVKLFGGPAAYAYDLTSSWRDYGIRADLQRCGLHVERDNPDATRHEGVRRRISSRDGDQAWLAPV